MIIRKLEDGWDFQPNWRALLVEEKLRESPDAGARQLWAAEEDLVVRQALRWKKMGSCAAADPMRWAYSCDANRGKNLSAAIIQAMVIAGCSREAIAAKVGAGPLCVTYFEKLHFDVRRYRHLREWLGMIAMPPSPVGLLDPISLKTRMYMAAAFHRGKAGLEQLMAGSVPKTAEETDQLTTEIRAAVTARAHEAMLGIMLTPAGADDVARFVEHGRLPAMKDRSSQDEKLRVFGEQMRLLIMRKAEEKQADSAAKVPQLSAPSAPLEITFPSAFMAGATGTGGA